MESFDKLVAELNAIAPFRIRYKDESWEMQILNLFAVWFCPTFLTHYTTVVGSTVYFPSRAYVRMYPDRAMRVLAHEAVHLLDMERYHPAAFMVSYLFPQIFAIGVFSFPWLGAWSLLFLLFLLPIPAPFRAFFEARAFAISLLAAPAEDREQELARCMDQFSNSSYYFMYPFDDQVKEQILKWIAEAETGRDPDLLKILLVYEMVSEEA
ncbi:hypothetical protein [Pontibacter sp. G13]|uniref:hypothetical protein n=1 Tax=Pontibacter sp. G13 TaxID=3074898 RepID=UPI0028891C87|nr:hypothetical protein [Pontibacter sp. G13]WNJ18602.1 hypothetical protein RJD25_27415 [Pontibacter sp. G13]